MMWPKQLHYLKYKYWNRELWCKGYDTAVKNAETIAEYIANQLREDQRAADTGMGKLL